MRISRMPNRAIKLKSQIYVEVRRGRIPNFKNSSRSFEAARVELDLHTATREASPETFVKDTSRKRVICLPVLFTFAVISRDTRDTSNRGSVFSQFSIYDGRRGRRLFYDQRESEISVSIPRIETLKNKNGEFRTEGGREYLIETSQKERR